MNLNHIAKKPFLDAFYIKPVMPHLLRAALYDAGTNLGGNTVGPQGALKFKSQIKQAHSS